MQFCGKRVHFIAIGGAGISAIARVARGWIWPVGAVPAEYAFQRSLRKWLTNPSAI